VKGQVQEERGISCRQRASAIVCDHHPTRSSYTTGIPPRDDRRVLLSVEQQVCAVEVDDDVSVLISCQINAQVIPGLKGIDSVEEKEGIMPADQDVPC